MLSKQFIKILQLCRNYNVNISYDQITTLCNIDYEDLDRILEIFQDCLPLNKKAFLEILTNIEFMEYHKFEAILDIISDIEFEHIYDLMAILNKPLIVKLPRLFEYINIYYLLANNPNCVYRDDVIQDIAKFLPEAAYDTDAEFIKKLLLDRIDFEYNYYVVDSDTIYFEDGEEIIVKDLEKYFYFHKPNKKQKARKLLKVLKKDTDPEEDTLKRNNIISIDFRKED